MKLRYIEGRQHARIIMERAGAMSGKFKKGFLGLQVKETNEYIVDLELKLQKEKFEYEEVLKALESDCLNLSKEESEFVYDEKSKRNISEHENDDASALIKLNYDEVTAEDKLGLEMEDYFESFSNESSQYKELISLKVKYEATVIFYGKKLKEIMNKYYRYIKTLEEKA